VHIAYYLPISYYISVLDFRAYFYNIFAFTDRALTQTRQEAPNDDDIRNGLGFKTFGRRQPATT